MLIFVFTQLNKCSKTRFVYIEVAKPFNRLIHYDRSQGGNQVMLLSCEEVEVAAWIAQQNSKSDFPTTSQHFLNHEHNPSFTFPQGNMIICFLQTQPSHSCVQTKA